MNKLIKKYTFFLFITSFFFLGIVCGIFYYYSQELPPLSELKHYDFKIGSEVFDKNDELIHTFSVERRKLTDITKLPKYFKDGMLSVEDKKFKKHWGIDVYGMIRAIGVDITKGKFSQGASTITQQLARNMFLSLDKKIPRKIKEAILAVRIERHFSKDEILEMYFNKVSFGPGLYGIEAASNKFFNKDAKDLNIAQAALIIGMTQLPSAYNPFKHMKRAVKRRNQVLKSMLHDNVITDKEYSSAVVTPINLYYPKGNHSAADYYIEYIRKIVTKKYGNKRLFTGGLKIYTNIDFDLTQFADSVLNANLTKFENKNEYEFKYADLPKDTTDVDTKYVQGAVFSIRPEDGAVRVMIGGRNFDHSKFNRIIQAKRQPGSSFKPILYSCALSNHYTPATIISQEPISFVENDTIFWKPHNYSNRYFGYTRMRDALKHSQNIYAVKMIYDLGPKKVVDFAKRFGITTKIWPVYSLAIGTCEVIPKDLISAYTTFPNNGYRAVPHFIRKILDKNEHVLERSTPELIKVLDKKTAYLMANLMKSVVDEGTGVGIRWRGYKWNAGGKTGTTDDYRDAWFIGYNKQLVTGIWVGFDNNSTLGKGKTGSSAALPSWPAIMTHAIYEDSPLNSSGRHIVDGNKLEFDRPDGIVTVQISKKTGLLPKSPFDETIAENFIAGTEPTPFSDSLGYNFYPTIYRINDKDSLIIDLDGSVKTMIDSSITRQVTYVYVDSLMPDSITTKRVLVDSLVINISGAKIFEHKTHKYLN
jgi:penicillin-binding protein 1A